MNWKRSVIGFGIAVPIIGLLGYGLSRDPRAIDSPLPGRAAPEFALAQLEATDSISLGSLRGNVVVVNFWASWCIPCRDEHPVLLEATRKYQPRGVKFVGIAYNDKPEDSKRWLDELGKAYPSLLDPGARTAIDYGVTGVPETFILDKQGVVAFKKFGPITAAEISQKLDSLLAAP
jgi:cytochrome c biogenesis protein CcmG, thiol:disulfide interchange protein DsbE